MTVEQFDPSTSNSAKSQTTTLDIPSKMIEEQAKAQKEANNNSSLTSSKESVRAAKIGFLSLG